MSLLLFFGDTAENYGDTIQDNQFITASGTVSTGLLQDIIPSYLYQQYADDQDLQAFVASYNSIAQGYLEWFNGTPLGLYISPNISGPLLDWIATGLYGILRPVFSTETTTYLAGLNSLPVNAIAINEPFFSESGTAVVATDDYYKRVLTWWLYLGDGRAFNIQMLRKKVARFLYGVNGTDIASGQEQNVSIVSTGATTFTITIPPGLSSTYFAQAFNQSLLAFPFMLSATVVIS